MMLFWVFLIWEEIGCCGFGFGVLLAGVKTRFVMVSHGWLAELTSWMSKEALRICGINSRQLKEVEPNHVPLPQVSCKRAVSTTSTLKTENSTANNLESTRGNILSLTTSFSKPGSENF